MNIVITMGGLGSRFRKVGYNLPKYMIKVKGLTLFEWSIKSLEAFKNDKFIFVVKREDNAFEFISEKCKENDIVNYSVVEIEKLTSGQAETVLFASSKWNENEELFIYNIDTYVDSGILSPIYIKGDGFIPCFKADGTHWSFVKLDNNRRAIEVREKNRISNNCSIGAYYFKTCRLYIDIYQKYYSKNNNMEKNERYIAPMYNVMIDNGMEVYIQDIPYSCVHVLGTPEEVEAFKNEN